MLKAWEKWTLYPTPFLDGLFATFLRNKEGVYSVLDIGEAVRQVSPIFHLTFLFKCSDPIHIHNQELDKPASLMGDYDCLPQNLKEVEIAEIPAGALKQTCKDYGVLMGTESEEMMRLFFFFLFSFFFFFFFSFFLFFFFSFFLFFFFSFLFFFYLTPAPGRDLPMLKNG